MVLAGKTLQRWMIGETWPSHETLLPQRAGNEAMERWGEFAELRISSACKIVEDRNCFSSCCHECCRVKRSAVKVATWEEVRARLLALAPVKRGYRPLA